MLNFSYLITTNPNLRHDDAHHLLPLPHQRREMPEPEATKSWPEKDACKPEASLQGLVAVAMANKPAYSAD